MRKLLIVASLFVSAFISGCAAPHSGRLTTASDPGVIRTVTGKVVSVETKRRSALTVTNTAAGVVTATQGSSALGIASFAIDVLDHQSAKSRENYTEVKLINEVSGKEEVWNSDIDSLPLFVHVGDRVRLIKKKYGAEASHNLTRFPEKDALTR